MYVDTVSGTQLNLHLLKSISGCSFMNLRNDKRKQRDS